MLPHLHFNKEDEDDDSEPQINEEQIIDQFAYHMEAKKHNSVIKAEQKMLEKNQDRLGQNTIRKKKLKGSSLPMVISINEDELIDKNIQIIGQIHSIARE